MRSRNSNHSQTWTFRCIDSGELFSGDCTFQSHTQSKPQFAHFLWSNYPRAAIALLIKAITVADQFYLLSLNPIEFSPYDYSIRPLPNLDLYYACHWRNLLRGEASAPRSGANEKRISNDSIRRYCSHCRMISAHCIRLATARPAIERFNGRNGDEKVHSKDTTMRLPNEQMAKMEKRKIPDGENNLK